MGFKGKPNKKQCLAVLFFGGCYLFGWFQRDTERTPTNVNLGLINSWLILIGGCPLLVVGFRPLLEGTPP